MVSGTPEHATGIEAAEAGRRPTAAPNAAQLCRGSRRRLIAAADAIAFSSALAASVGAALTLASSLALSAPGAGRWTALVGVATFFVYGLDRLRDLPRDRATSPARSRFVADHREALVAATAAAALATLVGIATAPRPVALLCLAIGAIGLGHRRLKSVPSLKVAYVATTWTAACVGIPALDAMGASSDPAAIVHAGVFVALFVGTGLVSNLIASNLRADKRRDNGWPIASSLAVAGAIAATGIAFAPLAPAATAPLAAIPAAEGIALLRFRASERYAHLAVDGALAIGAIVAACAIGLRAAT